MSRLPLSLIKKSAIKVSDKKSAIKISNKKTFSKKTNQNLTKIVLSMDADKEYKTVEIAEKVGLKQARTRELLKILAEQEIVESLGSNKNKRYKKR